MVNVSTRRNADGQHLGALEDGRIEIGGIQQDTNTQMLQGAVFLRCRIPSDARDVIEKLDNTPWLQRHSSVIMESPRRRTQGLKNPDGHHKAGRNDTCVSTRHH